VGRPRASHPELVSGVAPTSDGFVLVKGCKAGEKAFIHYPMKETVESQKILGQTYKLTWKGKSLLTLEPVDQSPIYKRSATGIAPGIQKKYFIQE
jgi:hypothetical protein